MKPIIRVENLGKQYHLGQRRAHHARYASLRETLMEAVRAPLKRLRPDGRSTNNTMWALEDVSFEVMPGEVVGIIGRNGAGKSTLLKILSRITEPTTGRVDLYGRVGSLLEVGTGFHPELTGRENIYLNAAILGMKRSEIERKFDEIVAFAEVEKFLDTQVKHYSSGMYVRLAFAVAAHLEPEILVIDEVLAVGDAQFQKKCLGKIGEVARGGRTVLFVSHNMAAVENLCQRGIVLDQGQVKYVGTQSEAIARYLASVDTGAGFSLHNRADRVGAGGIRVVAIEVKDTDGIPLDAVSSGQDVDVYLHYKTSPGFNRSGLIASVEVKTQMGVPVFLQHNRLTRTEFEPIPPEGAFVCRLQRLPLPPSTYRIGYSLIISGDFLDMIGEAGELTVVSGDFYGSGEVPPITHGCCLVDAQWRVEPAMAPKGNLIE
jgi:lipopolysaccharide transport system ATP-binding protein